MGDAIPADDPAAAMEQERAADGGERKAKAAGRSTAKVARGVEFTLRRGRAFSKSAVWAERENFYGAPKTSETCLIIGFDTEFRSPEATLTRDEISSGLAKNDILSYQVHCTIYDPDDADPVEWSGICYPHAEGHRYSLAEIIIFAVGMGVSSGAVTSVPTAIYLASHFNRADIPALRDFKDLTALISSVRGSFASVEAPIDVEVDFADGEKPITLKVKLRDTILMAPEKAKSLKALGDLVGAPKVVLDPDPERAAYLISHMDELLKQKPALFERYAATDPLICVRYLVRVMRMKRQLVGRSHAPVTLTGIGVDLLMEIWKNEGLDPGEVLGNEQHSSVRYNKQVGQFRRQKKQVAFAEINTFMQHATECYHGGRGEQFWFGPSFEDDWTDYDLAGAYPTAMATMEIADWRAIRFTKEVSEFGPTTLGMAWVEFEFPPDTRFPTLPVRTANGLIFPLSGASYCAAPEVHLAARLGAKLTIKQGVVVPPLEPLRLIFASYIQHCVQRRREHEKGTLEELLWKELTNATYGKTAQGLSGKRVFDLKEMGTKPLPPSQITQPFLAAYITSFVRGVLGEILNALPPTVEVFNCTTDGFLTNADADQIAKAQQGELAQIFGKTREALVGQNEILEVKHKARRLVGWRTRGQATLEPGATALGSDHNYALAKGGIYTPDRYETVEERNAFIVDTFFNRTPESIVVAKSLLGLRDIVELDAELVGTEITRRLNMEYDWKRRPDRIQIIDGYDHIAFSTRPWETVDQFEAIRTHWESEQIEGNRYCLKTLDDYRRFATAVLMKTGLGSEGAAWAKKKDPDINRLRQLLCSAWYAGRAGLNREASGPSAQQFADVLTAAGIPCKRTTVENGKRKRFDEIYRTPATPAVLAAIEVLKVTFPALDAEQLLADTSGAIDLMTAVPEAE